MGISITQLYRKYISKEVRDKVYKLFLGRVLIVLRNPRIYLWLYRNYRNKKKLDKFLSLFLDKTGLEIGGGTSFFSSLRSFPIYLYAKSVDGCNFSNETIWEGHIGKGGYSYNNRLLGKQFICEATNVHKYINTEYDFIISSHCLEHTANPLKAIMSWRNVLKQNGIILLILPNKQANFDHRRYYTSFTHILDDYNNQIEEDDMTHYDEIVSLHDLKMDKIENRELFIERSKNNYNNRCFHHHVFSESVLSEIFRFVNLDILYSGKDFDNIYIIGKK